MYASLDEAFAAALAVAFDRIPVPRDQVTVSFGMVDQFCLIARYGVVRIIVTIHGGADDDPLYRIGIVNTKVGEK